MPSHLKSRSSLHMSSQLLFSRYKITYDLSWRPWHGSRLRRETLVMRAALSWRFENELHQEIQIISEKKLLQWLKVMYIFTEIDLKCKFHTSPFCEANGQELSDM